jgi:hypothetical protein
MEARRNDIVPTSGSAHRQDIAEARALGKFLKLTEAMRAETGTTTIASIDATAEQHAQWAREFIRMLLWTEGTRCRKCGHVATGPLTEYTPEDVKRWREREVEVA